MPRPKVKPEDRQRSARACLPCKASKIRCDAETPCGPCSKRERESACVYLEPQRKRQKKSPLPTPSIEDWSPRTGFENSPSQQTRREPVLPIDPALLRSSSIAATSNTTPEPGQSAQHTRSRMLLSSKGEKLYIGENASLSFLEYLRRVLRKYMGPSQFTENQFKEHMLEVEMFRDESPVDFAQSRSERRALVQLYREASSGILDLYTVDEIQDFVQRKEIRSPQSDFEDRHVRGQQAALNMMLAIGSQCRGHNPKDSYFAAKCFTRAQHFAFEDFLCDPSLDLVKIFLLMAFYMLGACHRNAAFMYLGIASKAACAIGIHRNVQHKGLTRSETLTRWRTWKSLLILDTIVSSILGRPGGLPSMRPDEKIAKDRDDETKMEKADKPRWLASRAVFTICSHIIELEEKMSSPNNNGNIATAESFLERLRGWNDTLPVELRRFGSVKNANMNPADRELFIGAVHVACSYYFTTILVTRPFLISHLMSQVRKARTPNVPNRQSEHPALELAQACLDSAIYMSKTGYMAISSGILSNNMCLLKAWMLAAGLLLGFSMFANSEPDAEVEDSFQKACTVLERLAQASPQARHYFEILTAFSEAINEHRQRLGRERRKKSDRFVSQIFTADLDPVMSNANHAVSMTSPSSGALDGTLDGALDFNFDASGLDVPPFPGQAPGEEWADLPFLSDNLYIDWSSIWAGENV